MPDFIRILSIPLLGEKQLLFEIKGYGLKPQDFMVDLIHRILVLEQVVLVVLLGLSFEELGSSCD
jgi:hypothetical protein